jgi:hypothetical protein
MFVDYILNGKGHGPVGEELGRFGFDPGYLRPFVDSHGKYCVTIRTGRTENRKNDSGSLICNRDGVPIEYHVMETVYVKDLMRQGQPTPVVNATTLRKDEWLAFDQAVVKQPRARLQAFADLAAANSFTMDGMSSSLLEWETANDPGEAVMDMDGLTTGRDEDSLYQLEAVPLPITHSDFSVSERRLMQSRKSGSPIDTTRAETSSRKVSELIEKHTIGQVAAYGPFGDTTLYDTSPQVYGYTTEPSIITGTALTIPTSTNPDVALADILAMRDQLYNNNYYGPFMLYHTRNWDQFLDNDYITGTAASGLAAPNTTLRQRITAIEGITAVRRLDLWQTTTETTEFELMLVQMTPDVARAIIGMQPKVVQWDTVGGLRKNFKVMAIMVPNIRHDFRGRGAATAGTGINRQTV